MKFMAAVIIPVYKEQINDNEIISLEQCVKILNNHPIIFITSKNLDTSFYEGFCKQKVNFLVKRFDDFYFEGIMGYNRLMLSASFYKAFIDYKFILIHQLDAYVFKDDLEYWCSQGYDYIGAPHLPHQNRANEVQFLKGYSKFINFFNGIFRTNHKISNVGNGGFSLRKTKTFYRMLKILKPQVSKWGANNEDGFFKYWGNILYPFFKLPPDEIALRFSIEISPKESLAQIENTLPFGCHAFEKYDWETWKSYILSK
jgi:hypothetical protein